MIEQAPDLKSLTVEQKRALAAKMLQNKAVSIKRAPVSYTQQRLWLLDQLEPGNPAYHITAALRLTGTLNRDALEKALSAIVRRHESLRTTFELGGEEPVQMIRPHVSADLPLTQTIGVPESDFKPILMADARRPFDLGKGPLFRASLYRRSEAEHVLLVVMHHIISDGWSIGVLIREVSELYTANCNGAASPLDDLPIQYADYAVWQRQQLSGTRLEALVSYWKERLTGVSTLEMPTDRPRPPIQGSAGARLSVEMRPALAGEIDTICHRERVTAFMFYLAAFKVLLSRWCNQDDVVIGTPIANRTRVETEGLIGFFANTLVLRTDLSGEPTFREVLARVRKTAMGAFDHQEMPFERIVEEINPPRDTSRNPLFQISLLMQNTPREKANLPGLVMSREDRDEHTAKFDLSLSITRTRTQQPRLILEYSTDLFDTPTVERLLQSYLLLLDGAVRNLDAKTHDLPLLSDIDRTRITQEWNETASPFPADACVHHLFEKQAAASPDAVAVECAERRLTYRELNERSNRVAHHLRTLGVGPEVIVGICVERSLEMMVGLLGIMKAGGAYVPLDPVYPQDRLSYMLTDAGAKVLVTQRRNAGSFPEYKGAIVCLDGDTSEIDACSVNNPKGGATAENLVNVIYTSGSTGRPKGVEVPHRPLVNLLCSAAKHPGLTKDDTLLANISLSFDPAGMELYLPLIVGARLIIAGRDESRDGAALIMLIRQAKVTAMVATPPTWRMILAENQPLPPIRVMSGGDHMPRDLADPLLSFGGELWNLYGPTETIIYSTFQRVLPDGKPVTIGRPIDNARAYVLDPRRQPLPVGVPGELYIGGVGIARGYLNRPDLTAERFLPDPFNPGGRVYRTGDLARWKADGTIEVLGRIDNQVKIRGFRIELGEIEAELNAYPEVREALVLVREDTPGDKRLAAYLIPKEQPGPSGADLRDHLRQKLPEYMVPTAYVMVEAFPRLPNGKLDRNQLPAPDYARTGSSRAYVAPRTNTEDRLAPIWAEVLKLERVGVEDNFFDLGGHSLLAARVANRATSVFGTDVALRMLFQHPTIAQMAAHIDEAMKTAKVASALPLVPMPRDGLLPLSHNQEALWFLDQLDPGKATYLISQAARMRGDIDIAILEKAVTATMNRHESLRTAFKLVDGKPTQAIAPPQPFHIAVIDLSQLSEEEQIRQGHELIVANRRDPYDLSSFPLFRIKVVKLASQDHILLISVHHIVFDGWSAAILTREIVGHYLAFRNGTAPAVPALPVQYADYVVWQRQYLQGELLDNLMKYWKGQLATQTPLDLPTDFPRPRVRKGNGANARVRFSPELTASIHRFCRQHGATPFMALLAAFQAVMHYYCRQQQYVSVGSPVASRTRIETENLIGYFINMLLLNTDLGGDPTFAELLSRVRSTTLDAIDHQEIPLGLLVTEENSDRDLSRHPRIDVMFVLQNNERPNARLPGIQLSSARRGYRNVGTTQAAAEQRQRAGRVPAKFDLSVVLSERRGQLRGGMNYNTDLFREETANRIIRHFRNLVQNAVANPDLKLSQLTMLDEEELRWVTSRWKRLDESKTSTKLVHQMIEEQVKATPQAVAVVWGDERLTYAELNARANKLARYLMAQGVGPDKAVGICVARSPDMVVSVLAVLKAGGAYIPMNPEHDPERLRTLLESAAAVHLITQQPLRDLHGELGVPTICLDTESGNFSLLSQENVGDAASGGNLAYILFTSGSTGTPKGVMITHDNLRNAWDAWEDAYKLSEWKPTYLQMANFSFDVWPGDFVRSLCSGGRLVLCPGDVLLEAGALHEIIQREQITAMEFVPVVLRGLLTHLEAAKQTLEGVKLVVVGADAWYVRDHRKLQALAGKGTRVLNSYGITEATIDSSIFEGDVSEMPIDGIVPIGKPFANTEYYILNKYQQPVPIGVPGELYVGGPSVARGYAGRDDLTAERFVPNPFSTEPGARLYKSGDLARWLRDGNVEFLGRTDFQVKVRGFRIEPGEIEVVLKNHPKLTAAAVVPRPVGNDTRLYAYVVPKAGEEITIPELRAYLAKKVPDYMIPSSFVALDALPMTTSGKIDRQSLPEPGEAKSLAADTYAAPRTDVEAELCTILADLLKLDKVGIHDNFFEIGGHSLLAVQVIVKVREKFTGDLPLAAIFTAPTVAGLAERIAIARGEKQEEPADEDENDPRGRQRPAEQAPLVALQPHGSKPPIYLVPGLVGQVYGLSAFARGLGMDQPVYALQSRGLFDKEMPDRTIEEMAARYLRAIRSHQPHGPYLVGGFSMGGTVALEMGRQLAEANDPAALVFLLDSRLPSKKQKARLKENLSRNDEQILFAALTQRGLKRLLQHEDPEKLPRVLAHLGLRVDLPKDLPAENRWAFFKERVLEQLNDQSSGELTDLQALIRTLRAHMQAELDYEPVAYKHRILLVKAERKKKKKSWNPLTSLKAKAKMRALKKMLPQVEIVATPGSHFGMMRGENLKALTGMLNQQLAEAVAQAR